ncbi:DNA excision repair protein ERCC-6-like isoform X1 [Centruroides sculpturatus]|uniref:DNA excision repair protein ERCC-6-like isoform X1 n=1 Tax=Centruroides sculpturatus TaxID=218467 RepID=UPI000C6C8DC9|nr:DNA excision repair protein ERCC-6-like isoform X1 [Centruroides sculpturatus]
MDEEKEIETKEEDRCKVNIGGFSIDTSCIPCVSADKQTDELAALGVFAYDQTEFETNVIDQVDKAIKKEEDERKKSEAKRDLKAVLDEIKMVQHRLDHIEKALAMVPLDTGMSKEVKRTSESVKREKENKIKQLKKLEAKRKALNSYLNDDSVEIDSMINELEGLENCNEDAEDLLRLKDLFAQNNNTNDQLIKTGQMTPFGTVAPSGQNRKSISIFIPDEPTEFEKFLLAKEENIQNVKMNNSDKFNNKIMKTKMSDSSSKQNINKSPKLYSLLTKKSSKIHNTSITENTDYHENDNVDALEKNDTSNKITPIENIDLSFNSDSEYLPDSNEEIESDYNNEKMASRKRKIKTEKDVKSKVRKINSGNNKKNKIKDDGSTRLYVKRINDYRKQCAKEKYEKLNMGEEITEDEVVEFDGNFKIPAKSWNKLYRYQQTGVRWLWELHQQNCGGIVGDEMGLGKTIQVIVFLSGLQFSKIKTIGDQFTGLGPVILVCPATVMYQWVKEFHIWCPLLRVAILHESGSYSCSKVKHIIIIIKRFLIYIHNYKMFYNVFLKKSLVEQINSCNGILITSYAGICIYQNLLLSYEWHYIILDEGHKIRNPDAQVTLACKQFRTCHRLILSGSPIQNNLKELWSLFDFVYPGKLGTLPVFLQQFAVPITQGGYSNASEIQVQTAYKCATMLRDTIKPYLLRRMKEDVKTTIQLPEKNEQVLFCKLTDEQRELYKQYLESQEAVNIMNGSLQIFVGLINLRKICNHPDIFTGGPKIFDSNDQTEETSYGYYKRSGKMMVVKVLLQLWHKQKQKVLLFTQSRKMIKILEKFTKQEGYTYILMDGTTSIAVRQSLITNYNNDPNIFLFLLTTRVGGLGVNLTGANRVIIYDPDWNPSTDVQARERAWRIGQERQVTIYRLLTSGTIEEKIYHRQIFKQFLTNRVLKDPRQRRFFKTNHLHELFFLGEPDKESSETETSAIFAGTGSEVKISNKRPKKKNKIAFSPEKIKKMKQLAKQISSKLKLEKSCKNNTPVDNAAGGVNMESEQMLEKVPEISKNMTKKNESHKKKRNIQTGGCVFEDQKIEYLVKKDVYRPPVEEEEEEEESKKDDYVLHKLFKKSKIFTAMKHDKIMDSADPDYLLVEGEAERVAREAVKALKHSRRQCLGAEYGVPTWTGTQGISGAPKIVRQRFGQKKRFESNCYTEPKSEIGTSSSNNILETEQQKVTITSSSDLLARIKVRNGVVASTSHSNEPEAPALGSKPATEHDELLVEVRNYIAFGASVDGQATTEELLRVFKDKVPAKSTAIFKSLLNQICDFYRSADSRGIWKLKSDFR